MIFLLIQQMYKNCVKKPPLRNKKDFSFSEIEVLTSEEYVLLKHII